MHFRHESTIEEELELFRAAQHNCANDPLCMTAQLVESLAR